MKSADKTQAMDQEDPIAGPDFLVNEETGDVKPTGVDDESTGKEGDDFLGETNLENRDDGQESPSV